MIADSQYATDPLVLSPTRGALAGAVGTLVMQSVFFLGGAWGELTLLENAARLGAAFGFVDATQQMVAGFFTQTLLGILLGILYALCQQHIPTRGLIVVGMFYGFVLWIVGGLLASWLFGENLRALLRTPLWFIALLSFGLTLALSAAWSQQRASGQRVAAPKD